MRQLIAAFLLGLTLAAPATAEPARDRLRELLPGSWEGALEEAGLEVRVRMEFARGGQLLVTVGAKDLSKTIERTYRVLDGRTFETDQQVRGRTVTAKFTVESIARDRMVLSGSGSKKKMEFVRVKRTQDGP